MTGPDGKIQRLQEGAFVRRKADLFPIPLLVAIEDGNIWVRQAPGLLSKTVNTFQYRRLFPQTSQAP